MKPIHIAMTFHAIALAAFAALALAVSHPHSDSARCTTDSDCAARFGGDGGPAPAR